MCGSGKGIGGLSCLEMMFDVVIFGIPMFFCCIRMLSDIIMILMVLLLCH